MLYVKTKTLKHIISIYIYCNCLKKQNKIPNIKLILCHITSITMYKNPIIQFVTILSILYIKLFSIWIFIYIVAIQ